MVICLERSANDLHMVHPTSVPPHHLLLIIQTGLTFLVPAYPGCCGKEAAKWVSIRLSKVVNSIFSDFCNLMQN